ncbi:hypothetical protein GUJ93_ZPchr0011g28073 [Zizania palustris]|uniref:Beta-carotene isomerase D27-like C-terminal domain-containing protein n=1 Tax=Zizania palustris TaxID=103762 RepID=A0A8J5WIY6_ZIZPA|nr:hypothetical protein GUJ93_ZPchr0011g28073 [Zizania palustris]
MDSTTLGLLAHGGLRRAVATPCVMKQIHARRRRCSMVRAVMARPPHEAPAKETPAAATAATAMMTPAPVTVYRDNWFDKLAIGYLSRNLQEASGLKNEKDGYEGLIDATLAISRIFSLDKQCEIVTHALERALPSYILTLVKVMMPPSRFSREYFAAFTTILFPWLVGPCEVMESEVDGLKEKNVVYIPKCRFLESTNCVGMCTNLCKIPCQKFIQDSLGMKVYMSPNFEDMSCEMIFGQQPPEDDPALKQPCFQTKCIAKQNHGVNCSI